MDPTDEAAEFDPAALRDRLAAKLAALAEELDAEAEALPDSPLPQAAADCRRVLTALQGEPPA